MKTIIHSSILLALASSGIALGAATATTTPVGYVTQALGAGFNMCGLTVQSTTKMAGDLDVISPGSVQDTSANVNFTTALGATGVLHVLEITNGPAVGLVTEITTWTTDTITTVDNLVTAGVLTGNTYRIRKCPTLEDIFTIVPLASGGVLASALSVGSSDVVWLPTGTGGFNKYYLRTSTGGVSAFRSTPANVETPGVPVVYVDGIIIEKKDASAASLLVTGEVKANGSNSSLAFGYNLVSIVAPAGLNLYNAGFEDNLDAALSVGSADEVWVQQPDKSFVKYFRRSGAGAGWRVAGSTVTLTQLEAEAVILPNSVLIYKKNPGIVPLSLNVPAFYSGF